ncbi:hypothetical protein C8Q74DRAFT_1249703 [Fomes fomentarius]|nr:hypothetical protein C8Q74DRAFT_1249703 [Fomes fomentarius]
MGFAPCTENSNCAVQIKAAICVQMTMYLLWAVFSALRAYALSRKVLISCLVFVLSIVVVCTNLVDVFGFYRITCIPELAGVCTSEDTIPPKLAHWFTIAARSSLMAADIVLISITWALLGRRTSMSSENTLTRVMLLDGAIYFVSLFVLNALHLSFTLVSEWQPATQNESKIVLFIEPLTSILIWRFMLALQSVNNSNVNLDSQGVVHSEGISSHADSIIFERVVGSLSSLASRSTLRTNDTAHLGSMELHDNDSPIVLDGVECLALETR